MTLGPESELSMVVTLPAYAERCPMVATASRSSSLIGTAVWRANRRFKPPTTWRDLMPAWWSSATTTSSSGRTHGGYLNRYRPVSSPSFQERHRAVVVEAELVRTTRRRLLAKRW